MRQVKTLAPSEDTHVKTRIPGEDTYPGTIIGERDTLRSVQSRIEIPVCVIVCTYVTFVL